MNFEVKCFTCRKKPRNCNCYEYRWEKSKHSGAYYNLYVDNVCVDPVKGEDTGTWTPKRGSKVYRRPLYQDGFGPLLTVDYDAYRVIKGAIENGTFSLQEYGHLNIFGTKKFDKDMVRRFKFLRTRAKVA